MPVARLVALEAVLISALFLAKLAPEAELLEALAFVGVADLRGSDVGRRCGRGKGRGQGRGRRRR